MARGQASNHQHAWGGAFAAGLRRHGWRAEVTDQPGKCDLLVLWGVRRQEDIAAQKRRGGQVCILERGYIGDRHRWTSVSLGGGLNGEGRFPAIEDPARFNQHFRQMMTPWRMRPGYALLIGQVPGDMSLQGANIEQWYREMVAALAANDFEVKFRPHPVWVARARRTGMMGAQGVRGACPIGGTLEDALSGAAVCVTFSSNTGVESVLAGVPTVAVDRRSMAWPVSAHDVDDPPFMPDRSAWASRLAWCQWTLDEMAAGEAWAAVKEVMDPCALAS